MKIRLKEKDDSGNPIPAQMFTGHAPFQPGEEREMSEAEGEILLRSPFMEAAGGIVRGAEPKKNKNIKGVDAE